MKEEMQYISLVAMKTYDKLHNLNYEFIFFLQFCYLRNLQVFTLEICHEFWQILDSLFPVSLSQRGDPYDRDTREALLI